MKFRTDFVTNSSSSSFIIEIDVNLINGTKISLEHPETVSGLYETLSNYCESMEEGFTATPDDFFNCEDLFDLVQVIEEGIDLPIFYEEEDEEDIWGIGARKQQIEDFTNKIHEEVTDIAEIESVEIRNNYLAWGEFCSCIVENDETLQELASEYLEDDCEENKEALLAYMRNADNPCENDELIDCYFAEGVERFQYSYWNGDLEENLKEVAESILAGGGSEIGIEYLIVNLKTGDYENYATLEIQ